MSHSDVFVIGAGPAGLAASYLLTNKGLSTTVIEADRMYVGGISRTVKYKDLLIDIGGHPFFSKSQDVIDLWGAMANALRNLVKPTSLPDGTSALGSDVIKTLFESFLYPHTAPVLVWESAADKMRAQGGVIHMGHRLAGLDYDRGQKLWTVTALRQDGETVAFTASHVISSASISELMASITERLQSIDNASLLTYRDFITVALVLNKPDRPQSTWINLHEPSIKAERIQNLRSCSREMVPDDKVACLGVEYLCFDGDGLWTSSDNDLIALAKAELVTLGFATADDLIEGCVVRHKNAFPVCDAKYKHNVKAIRRELAEKFPSLHLIGRNGMDTHNSQDHAMVTVALTVENIVANEAIYDIWNGIKYAGYYEAGNSGADDALKSVRMVPSRLKRASS